MSNAADRILDQLHQEALDENCQTCDTWRSEQEDDEE